jgi:hypothetical protein
MDKPSSYYDYHQLESSSYEERQREYHRKYMRAYRKTKYISEKVKKWARSSEGQRAMERAMQQADRTIKKLQEARKVDPKSLEERITI